MKKKIIKYTGMSLYVILLMLFCAGVSPFTNGMGTDSSVFFTIGRGMAEGKVPYADLFDHKGWYIYFFNFLGACISGKTTWGLFIVECVFMAANTVLFYKIAALIFDKEKEEFPKYAAAAFMLLITLNFFTYQGGNFVESYGITFQLISIFFVVKYYKSGKIEHPPFYMAVHGVCAGIVLGLRVNMTAMWGAVGIVLIVRLFSHKRYKNVFQNLAAGLIGVAAGIFPVIFYCLKTKSLDEMFFQSVLFNFVYTSGTTLWENIINLFLHYRSLGVILGCAVSFLVIVREKWCAGGFRVIYGVSLLFSVVSTALSGRDYGHYYEYLIPFLMPVFIEMVKIISSFLKRYRVFSGIGVRIGMLACVFLFTIAGNMQMTVKLLGITNTQRNAEAADSMASLYKEQYGSKKKMLAVNNKSMFYNKFGLVPENQFFYLPAADSEIFPDGVNSQAESVLSGENDILIISYRDYGKKQIFPGGIKNKEILRYLEKDYDMVCEKNQIQMYVKRNK